MSKLEIRSRGVGITHKLNVLQFSAPLMASISTVQTRTKTQHFPIKVNQSEVSFLVQFSNEREFERFQDFVRRTQVSALINGRHPGVTLRWPERDIHNWTGVIKEFRAGGARFNFSPRAVFTVSLIDSMIAKRTFFSSIAVDWQAWFSQNLGNTLLRLPTAIEDARHLAIFGNTLSQVSAANAIGVPPPSNNITNGNFGIPGVEGRGS